MTDESKIEPAPGWNDEGRAWLASRPPAVRAKAEAYPPWITYRLKSTGQHARIASYSEGDDGTCETCCISAWIPEFPIAHGVFGIPFTDLEPLPPTQ